MPHVVVVVPVFNPGPYLKNALTSVCNQTLQDWECVVVDDGSAEDMSWVTGFDPRIRLLRKANGGPASARNLGVQSSGAPLIAFLDQDDLWEPGKIEAQVEEQQRTGASLVSTTFRFIDKRGRTTGAGYPSSARTYNDLLRGNPICASSVMATRAALTSAGGFDSRFPGVDDWDAWLRIAQLGQPLAHVELPLVAYRLHDDNLSSRYSRMWRVSVRVLVHHLLRALTSTDWAAAWAAASGMGRMGQIFGAQAYDSFRLKRGPADLVWALVLSPRCTSSALARKFLRRALR